MKKLATKTIGTSNSAFREDKRSTPISAVFKNKIDVVPQKREINAINSPALIPNNHSINSKNVMGAKETPVTKVNCL
ncbi:hypothetical protein PCC7424_5400 (plasmid) [Gloeothece citriformis PCC 7424]|uniref:Uncharacterized protein n=1 Tax=Gloeothece citriformis (strain PCC 7424) TaxID=65393 RepID=B7KMF6_GLOC7|nr:hypothetical protein [Gloeothece citriformis]ACK73978.1 hypothetical protein PCC7424_5400 [Gloeothece citriformis PCC 7424]